MRFFYRSILIWTILIAPISAFAIPFSKAVVFGDSLTDTHNLFAFTGGAVPNPVYYDNGRFQNGPSYIETLGNNLGLNIQARMLGGTNYAIGGARTRYHASDVDPVTGPPALGNTPSPLSLLGELYWYLSDLSTSGTTPTSDTLFVVWAGANDVADIAMIDAMGGAADQYLAQSIGDMSFIINTLINNGAKNLLIPNIPDLAVTPDMQKLGIDAEATAATLAFNEAMDNVLAGYAGLPNVEITRFDTFAFVEDVAADPDAFGFTNLTTPCLTNFFVSGPTSSDPVGVCTNPDEHVFWDDFHPSAAFHKILGNRMTNALPEPASIALMVFGLAGISFSRRKG